VPEADASSQDALAAGRPRFGAIGFTGGFLGSLLGVGGGFIMVPLQVMWARAAQHQANGTSLAAIAPMALVGVPVYALVAGEVDFRLAVPLAVGAVFGSYAGARLVSRLPEVALRRLVAVVLLLVGLKQLVFPG